MPKTEYFEPKILPTEELPTGGDIIRYAKFLSKDQPVTSKFVTNDLGKLHLLTINSLIKYQYCRFHQWMLIF